MAVITTMNPLSIWNTLPATIVKAIMHKLVAQISNALGIASKSQLNFSYCGPLEVQTLTR